MMNEQFFSLTDDNEKTDGLNGTTVLEETISNKRQRKKMKKWCQKNLLLILTLSGVVLGGVLGFALRATNPSPDTILLISFPGEILMRMFQMAIVPLIGSSLIIGMASLDAKKSGKLGLRAICYYLLTTILAGILGIILVFAIHPGDPDFKGKNGAISLKEVHPLSSLDSFLDVIRNLFPDNIIQACFQQTKTEFVKEQQEVYIEPSFNTSNLLVNSNSTTTNTSITSVTVLDTNGTNLSGTAIKKIVTIWVRSKTMYNGLNALGIMMFCITFGTILGNMGVQGKPMLDFFNILNDIITRMVNLAMWYAPIGIMSLIMGNILTVDDPWKLGSQLGLFIVTVVVGLAIHMLATLPVIYVLVVRKNPYRVISGMAQALATALSTSSSAATLPVTFWCLEENLGVDQRVTRFVLPVGANINMDGAALYEAIATIFIAQLNDIPVSFGDTVTISLTATLASIGASSMPAAGLVTMFIVLTAVGLPLEDVALVLTVDWFLDRIRTMINIFGDGIGACIVEHLSREDLNDDPQHNGMLDVNSHLHEDNEDKDDVDSDTQALSIDCMV